MADQNTQQSLGVAGQMAQSFIHSPLSPLLFIAMFFMGVMGLMLTPRQEDPQISVPMVDIFVQYQGASSQQVSSLAIDPLQRIMSEIPGVEHVYSAAERGQGMVTVQFYVGEELEKSVFKVHDKLQSNLDQMPPGVQMPLVKPKGVDDVPVVTLTLWSEDVDDSALRTLSLDVMHDMNKIEAVGKSFVVGGREEQVRIEVMPERLSGYNLSIGQIAQTIQTANSEQSAGYTETGGNHFTIYTGTFLRNAYDVEQLVVGTYQNRAVHVRDVAKVIKGPSETSQIVNYFSGPAYGYEQAVIHGNFLQELWGKITHKHAYDKEAVPMAEIPGVPAVTIAISKKIATNGVTVANKVLERIEALKGTVIPDNVHVEITRNYGKTAKDKVDSLILKLFIATGAVTLLVLYFFRHIGYQPAFVVTVVIPVVILITVFSAWILGFTIDRVSLFALIFSIGILVDDAIVVIENIYRRWLLSENMDTDTAVDAVREVGNPTILATFTVVAALLPMGFVSGMMGPYMAPIPVLGSVAMVFSLVAAFIFVPWIAMRVKPSMKKLMKAEEVEHKENERWERFYRRIIPALANKPLFGFGFLAALIVAFFLAIGMFYTTDVEVKMLPLDNKPEYNVYVDMPEGTALPVTANIVYQMAEKLRQVPEVTAVQTYVGTSQPYDFNGMVRHYYLRNKPWHADIQIQLVDKGFRERSSHQLATEARQMLQELLTEQDSDAKITIVEMPPGPPVLQAVVAEVYGSDGATRREVARQFTEFFEQSEIIDDADSYMADPYAIWKFEVDTEKAVRKGIAVDTINQNLMMALGGFKLGDIKQGFGLEPTYIVIQVPLHVRAQLSRLYDLPIPNNQGQVVSLAELGRFVSAPQDPIIYQKDLRPVEYVVGDSVGKYQGNNEYSLSAPIYGMLEVEAMLRDYQAPDGVNLSESGCWYPLGFIPMCQRYLGAPTTMGSGFEWAGEWTVTYQTFRDMGLAFAVALVLIYILVVWLFGNFTVPLVIMAPIPLTLLGIVPGHMLLGASFTATSMIGWIALAGIIVRNSILLVDYSIAELRRGVPLQDAVINACKTRTRPIIITAWALVGGGMVILYDPIFQGMAISLLFGVMVSTILTLIVIPLGCISVGEKVLLATGCDEPTIATGEPSSASYNKSTQHMSSESSGSFLGSIFSTIGGIITMAFYIVRALFMMLWMGIVALWGKLFGKEEYREEEHTVAQAVSKTPSSDSVKKKSVTPRVVEVIADRTSEPPPAPIVKPAEAKPVEPTPEPKAEEVAKPVESAPEPKAEEVAKPVEETPEPKVEEVAKPVESAPEPKAEEVVKPVEEAPEPKVEEVSKPVEPTPEPKAEEVAKPVEPTPEPKAEEVAKPVEPTPEPKAEEVAKPVEPTPEPKAEEVAKPVEEAPEPKVEEAAKPVEPKAEEVAKPVEPTPEPKAEEVAKPVEPTPEPKAEETTRSVAKEATTRKAPARKTTRRAAKSGATRKTAAKKPSGRRGIRLKTDLKKDDDKDKS
ncbi:efflux RND transporter permease subunit [Candidatus Albibeggiatoa sp. nov. NOAA]|uniref:efflux RND transporter permease subunit n=1 Tax=Candidatus Albibeggiatoa sp. nov. NOAA TaxID=3162724 RepID=UPI0033038899|nr:efflux RND transporter permease subunit [Thiotrichaceae bacterium]